MCKVYVHKHNEYLSNNGLTGHISKVITVQIHYTSISNVLQSFQKQSQTAYPI